MKLAVLKKKDLFYSRPRRPCHFKAPVKGYLYYSPKSLYYRNKKLDKCYQVILRPLVEEPDFEITQIDLRSNRTRLLIEITGQQHKKIAGWYGYQASIDLDDNSIIYMIDGLKWDTSPKWR